MSEPPSSPAQVETEHRFPCDSCGSDLRYAPGTDRLVCDHCGNTQPLEGEGPWNGAITEIDFRAALDQQLDASEIEEFRVAACPNCGAKIEFDATIHARECAYCATPVVTDTGAHRHIKPKGVVPFILDEAEARRAMTDWLGGLWFAPNGLTEYARKGRKMSGVYVPYWTFDADTRSSYRGERGTVYYETRTVMRGGERKQVRVQKVRWRPASGRVARFFDDVLVLASRSLPKRFTERLAPWDLGQLLPYQPEFLAGFRAEGYQVELADGFTLAKAQMDAVIQRDVRFDIGGDRQRIHSINTKVSDVTFKHILLPIWVAAYKYQGESYRFVVNGQTGRVEGERPWSIWKITLAVIAAALLAAAVGYGIALSENGGFEAWQGTLPLPGLD
ncbi:MAG: primosomal protein N' (replication factor Y) - superfamily II helicase [Pseudomonadota bacterium]